MALDAATQALIDRLNVATSKIAARIQAFIDNATKVGSATAAEIDAALSPIADQLDTMGTDPTNPVPPVA